MIDEQTRERICLIARTSPADWKITAFSTWSLSKLAAHRVASKVVPAISRETLRRILRDGKVTWQSTTTWKASTDPDFVTKMQAILDLYDHPPTDGRVVCVDEFGPLNLQPRTGRCRRPATHPRRLRATYHRYDGVMHMLAARDLASGRMYYRIRPRKRSREFLAFSRCCRLGGPGRSCTWCSTTSRRTGTRLCGRGRRTTTSSWCFCRRTGRG